jgi:hypothetical protein
MQGQSRKTVLKNHQKKALLLLVLSGLLSPLFAADGRSLPVDLFLIIDGSPALEHGRNEALDWLCGRVVDGLLQEGDSLTIWVAGDKAEELYSGSVAGTETKETVKALIRAITVRGKKADYLGALRVASKRKASLSPGGRLNYTLLICGMSAGYTSLNEEGEIFDLLRYSRFEDFSGWRAVTAAPGIEAEVKSAAAAFMR